MNFLTIKSDFIFSIPSLKNTSFIKNYVCIDCLNLKQAISIIYCCITKTPPQKAL